MDWETLDLYVLYCFVPFLNLSFQDLEETGERNDGFTNMKKIVDKPFWDKNPGFQKLRVGVGFVGILNEDIC